MNTERTIEQLPVIQALLDRDFSPQPDEDCAVTDSKYSPFRIRSFEKRGNFWKKFGAKHFSKFLLFDWYERDHFHPGKYSNNQYSVQQLKSYANFTKLFETWSYAHFLWCVYDDVRYYSPGLFIFNLGATVLTLGAIVAQRYNRARAYNTLAELEKRRSETSNDSLESRTLS